ncbi:reverse transcriptase domain-containing protein [Streptomyces virginiae]
MAGSPDSTKPEWGRRSRSLQPRVWDSGQSAEKGIVPATQAGATVARNSRPLSTHSLMPFLIEPRHLKRAARLCMRRASAPGADGQTWAAFRTGMPGRLDQLAEDLRRGQWRPGPVKESHVIAYTGKRIGMVIPTVGDRIVHRAMRCAIEPVLESRAFAPWVSGFRPGRNRLTSLRQAAHHLQAGRVCVADVDVKQASAGSSTEEVIGWLADHIQDGTFLARVRTALEVLPDPIAPGCGLSPMLLNLRLSRVDSALHGLHVVRFADNYCLFASDQAQAEAANDALIAALGMAGLKPHPGKSRIRSAANAEDLFLISG